MPFSTYQSILELNDTCHDWTMKARVLSIWPAYNLHRKMVVGMNMLLTDETNTRIQAFAGKLDYPGIRERVTCGKIYTITNFSVKKYGDETFTRPVRNDFRIFLSNCTKFEETPENDTLIPWSAFDLYDLSEVEKLASQTLHLTDIVGVVEEVKITHNLPDKNFVPFFISDGSYTVKVLFWNALGESFLEEMKKATEFPAIINISCCKAQNRGGDIHFSNTQATRFFINCDHYSVRMLRQKLAELPVQTKPMPISQERIIEPQLYQIAELHQFNIIMLNKHVKVKGTLTEYCLDNKWCERVCTKCQIPVHKVAGRRRCGSCKKNITYPNKRFRVVATVADVSGSATILLLDREVNKIVGKSILQLHVEDSDDDKDEDDAEIPDILQKLLHKEFTLTLLITENNLTAGDSVYTCSHVQETADNTVLISSAELSPNLTMKQVMDVDSGATSFPQENEQKTATEWSSTKDRITSTLYSFSTAIYLSVVAYIYQVLWLTNNLTLDTGTNSVANDSNIPLLNLQGLTGLKVFDIPPEVFVKCYAHVGAMDDLDHWFTETCAICGYSLFVRDVYLYCPCCERIVYYPLRRLSIRVYVHDDMCTALLHLPHDVVHKLIPSAIHYLPRGQLRSAVPMPVSFLHIIGKKFLFVIQTKIANLRGESSLWSCVDAHSV